MTLSRSSSILASLMMSVPAACLSSWAWAMPANDLIGNAIVLPGSSGTVTGTTTGATADAGIPPFGTSVSAPGVWYRFTGTGQTFTFDTFAPVFTYDSKLHGYTGFDGLSLGSLVGLDSNDDTCGTGVSCLQSQISFATTSGEQYWVLVNGFAGQTGDFTLNWSVPGPSGADLIAELAANSATAARIVVLNAHGVARTQGQNSIATRNAYSSFTRVTDPDTGETSVVLSTQDRPNMLGELYGWIELTGFEAEDTATARDYNGAGLQIGADIPVRPDMVAGLSLGVQDLDSAVGVVSQEGVLRFIQPYLAYTAGQWSGEATLMYGTGDFTQTSGGGTGEGETKLSAITFNGGYDIAMPQGYTLTPMVGLSHGVERVEGISGTLAGTGVERVRFTQTSLGAQASRTTDGGEVFAGLHADYLDTSADTALVTNLLVDDGWTGRLEFGFSTQLGLGRTMNASLEVSGLGGDLRSTAGGLRFAFQF